LEANLKTFLEYASNKNFSDNIEVISNLLEETGSEGIVLVQN